MDSAEHAWAANAMRIESLRHDISSSEEDSDGEGAEMTAAAAGRRRRRRREEEEEEEEAEEEEEEEAEEEEARRDNDGLLSEGRGRGERPPGRRQSQERAAVPVEEPAFDPVDKVRPPTMRCCNGPNSVSATFRSRSKSPERGARIPLHGITGHIPAGEIVALRGPSGAGRRRCSSPRSGRGCQALK